MILMELKKTTGYHVFSALKQGKTTAIMFLFDVLFGVCLFAMAKLFDTIFEHNEAQFIGSTWGYLLLLGYFFLIIFAHSFFKYCLFDCWMQIEQKEAKKEKAKFAFEKLGLFYAWNLLMYSILGVVTGTMYLFFAVSLVSVLKTPALVLLAVFFTIGSYIFSQTSHIIFFENQFKSKEVALKEIPKRVWNMCEAKKIARWLGWNVLWGILFFAVYFLLYLGVMSLAQKAATDATAMTEFYVLNVIIFVLLIILCYGLLVWNSVYLFLSFREKTV